MKPNLSRKTKLELLAIGLMAILAFAAGAAFIHALAPTSSTFTYAPGVYSGAPTYTIYKDAATSFYDAKNVYGYNDFSSVDAATVIQEAINAVGSSKGTILLESGQIFTLKTGLTISNPQIVLEGGGQYNTALVAGSSNMAMLTVTADYTSIHDLAFAGESNGSPALTNVVGISASTVFGLDLENVYIHNCNGYGVYSSGMIADGVWNGVNVEFCGNSSTSKAAVSVQVADLKATALRIIEPYYLGLQLNSGSSNNYFGGFKFEGDTPHTANGILIKNTSNENQFIAPTITSVDSYYVKIESLCEGNLFQEGTFNYLNGADGLIIAGNNNQFTSCNLLEGSISNTGYENSFGSSTNILPPVLFLPFSEDTGTTTKDCSPYNNTVTLTGTSWVTGVYGSALAFNGASDTVACGNKADLGIGSQISVMAWVKLNSVSGTQRIVEKSGDGYEYSLYTSGSDLCFIVYQNGGATCALATNVGLLTTGAWVLVTGTYKFGVDISAYVNTTSITDTHFTGSPTPGSSTLYVGSRYGSTQWLNGDVCNVLVFNYQLTPADIINYWNLGQ